MIDKILGAVLGFGAASMFSKDKYAKGGSTYARGGEIALYNTDSKTIVSRGLTSDMVDDLMYRQNKIKNKNLKVIQDVSEEEIVIQDDGSIKLKKGVEPTFLGLDYAKGGSTYQGGGTVKRVENDDEHGADAFLVGYEPYFEKDVNIARIDDKSKTVKPTHGYFPKHPLSKKAMAWAKKNGYKYIFEDGGSTYQGG